MKIFLIKVIVFFIIFFAAAVGHEYDLSNNFNKTGDASAWFFPIKSNK